MFLNKTTSHGLLFNNICISPLCIWSLTLVNVSSCKALCESVIVKCWMDLFVFTFPLPTSRVVVLIERPFCKVTTTVAQSAPEFNVRKVCREGITDAVHNLTSTCLKHSQAINLSLPARILKAHYRDRGVTRIKFFQENTWVYSYLGFIERVYIWAVWHAEWCLNYLPEGVFFWLVSIKASIYSPLTFFSSPNCLTIPPAYPKSISKSN